MLALGLLGGALADVIDRRRLVLLTELALMATSGALVWNSTLTHPSVILVFAVAAVGAGGAGVCAVLLPAFWRYDPRSASISSSSASSLR